jgi:hypothetical protein
MGRALGERGLRLRHIALDLDETVWDWRMAVLRQPRALWAHDEEIFVRWPLVWLLQGIASYESAPVRVWTAGYGYRVDRICNAAPALGALFGMGPDMGSDELPTLLTRLDYVRAVESNPALIPGPGRWGGQKIPGVPTAAGKPAVDRVRVLVDDKETNCERFAAAGKGKAAIWLRGTPRVWGDSLQRLSVDPPPRRHWAAGVARALGKMLDGADGVLEVDAETGGPERTSVRVTLPHWRAWSEWLGPGKRLRELTPAR